MTKAFPFRGWMYRCWPSAAICTKQQDMHAVTITCEPLAHNNTLIEVYVFWSWRNACRMRRPTFRICTWSESNKTLENMTGPQNILLVTCTYTVHEAAKQFCMWARIMNMWKVKTCDYCHSQILLHLLKYTSFTERLMYTACTNACQQFKIVRIVPLYVIVQTRPLLIYSYKVITFTKNNFYALIDNSLLATSAIQRNMSMWNR